MKKLLLSALTLVSLSAFAQKDLTVTLVTPTDGKVLNSKKPFAVAYIIKNVGADTVMKTDTFLISGAVVSTNAQFIFLKLSSGGQYQINPGDSIIVGPENGGHAIVFDQDKNTTDAQYCVAIAFTDTSLNNTDDNDFDCNNIVLQSFPTAVSEVNELASSVKTFPNPANTYFTISMKSANATVNIVDITGKLIETVPVALGEARLDVSNYKGGVYFYQIKNENNEMVKSGKFTVNH